MPGPSCAPISAMRTLSSELLSVAPCSRMVRAKPALQTRLSKVRERRENDLPNRPASCDEDIDYLDMWLICKCLRRRLKLAELFANEVIVKTNRWHSVVKSWDST